MGLNKDKALERHKQLISQGWVRRFSVEEPRLSEMKEFYQSLGMEVLVESWVIEEGECRDCFDQPTFQSRYKTIYTKGKVKGKK